MEIFGWIVVRVLFVIGLTLFPIIVVNLWFDEEVIRPEGWALSQVVVARREARYAWLRYALNIVVGTLSLAIVLSIVRAAS